MKTFFKITRRSIRNTRRFIRNHLRFICSLCNLLLPFLMLYIGQNVALSRGHINIGGEVFVPLVALYILHIIKEYANKINKGEKMPIPSSRFTTIYDDDQVNVRNDRLQEMIIYVAELEEFIERRGLRDEEH